MKPTRSMIVLLALITVMALSFGTFTYVKRAASERVYAYNCGLVDFKPTSLTPFCADAGVGVFNMKWERWSAQKSVATGRYGINLCNPNCARGKWSFADVEVTLTKSVLDKGKKVLTRIDFVTIDGKNLPLSNKSTNGWNLERTPL